MKKSRPCSLCGKALEGESEAEDILCCGCLGEITNIQAADVERFMGESVDFVSLDALVDRLVTEALAPSEPENQNIALNALGSLLLFEGISEVTERRIREALSRRDALASDKEDIEGAVRRLGDS